MEKNKKTKKEKTNFTGKAGTSIKIITETIKKETKRKAISVTHNRKINKDKIKSGKIMTSDMDAIRVGMKILNKIMQNSLNRVEMDLKLGKGEDINQKQKYIYEYRKIINSFINSISRNIEEEMAIQADIDYVEECTDIVQAARDGILLKQEERTEMIDGEEKKLVYDTTITEKEVLSVLDKYQRIKNDVKLQKLENYLGIGLSAAGIIGTMVRDKNNSLKMNSEKIMTLSFIAVKSIKLLGDMTNKNIIGKKKENLKEISDQRRKIKSETLENEHISSKDKERTIENYKFLRKKEQKAEKGIDNYSFIFENSINLLNALIIGAFINNKVRINGNGKLNAKDFASAIIDIDNANSFGSSIFRLLDYAKMTKERENDFKDIYINVEKIITQMEEKVYSLHGPTHSFDSMSINNLVGKFHPRKDYETGEIKYLVTIKVPEFSMKRGDVVLLSGESGVGKSTFLRLLKRGDYNNRDTIQLNTGEKVDNFGNEYISFRPSTKLGNEKSVLYEITGKDSISSLTKNERKNLLEILTKLSFPQKDLLEHLATKKFAEFSTGQQRRLALSKLFYRIEDGGSVIIVDEPVENVEEKLIKEQLQMIVNYAKQRNVMLIITTHRLDLAKDLATKRYNINKEGVLEQIPIKDKEQDR